jgi:DinB superfamily
MTSLISMNGADFLIPEFYRRYVTPIQNYSLRGALTYAEEKSISIARDLSEEQGLYRYQPGKWSIKEVFCHTLDVERIMCYRALCFARNDRTVLPGFDENSYATEANAENRTLGQISVEMVTLRQATNDLFASFSEVMLSRKGIANDVEFSVAGLGYIIAGHSLHHCNVLVERYLSERI